MNGTKMASYTDLTKKGHGAVALCVKKIDLCAAAKHRIILLWP